MIASPDAEREGGRQRVWQDTGTGSLYGSPRISPCAHSGTKGLSAMKAYEKRRPLPSSLQAQVSQSVAEYFGSSTKQGLAIRKKLQAEQRHVPGTTTNTPCLAVIGLLPVERSLMGRMPVKPPQTSGGLKMNSPLAEVPPSSRTCARGVDSRAGSPKYLKKKKKVARNLWLETSPLMPWG